MSNYRCPKCKELHSPLRMCEAESREALRIEELEVDKLAKKVFQKDRM
jgi:hypothetical protein